MIKSCDEVRHAIDRHSDEVRVHPDGQIVSWHAALVETSSHQTLPASGKSLNKLQPQLVVDPVEIFQDDWINGIVNPLLQSLEFRHDEKL